MRIINHNILVVLLKMLRKYDAKATRGSDDEPEIGSAIFSFVSSVTANWSWRAARSENHSISFLFHFQRLIHKHTCWKCTVVYIRSFRELTLFLSFALLHLFNLKTTPTTHKNRTFLHKISNKRQIQSSGKLNLKGKRNYERKRRASDQRKLNYTLWMVLFNLNLSAIISEQILFSYLIIATNMDGGVEWEKKNEQSVSSSEQDKRNHFFDYRQIKKNASFC